MHSTHPAPAKQICRWHSFTSTDSLEKSAVEIILESAHHAIHQRSAFHLVLAGGNTPRRIYKLLSKSEADWQRWHIYFGDERCLPAAHPERNSLMATQNWLHHVPIPATQIHFIPAELGAFDAARQYANTLSKIDYFDLVLLGLGEDGHTASLFPNHNLGHTADAAATLAIFDAPKPPAERVSLSAKRLSQTHELVFIITGANKAEAIQNWRAGVEIPAAAITPEYGIDILIEANLIANEEEFI